ncbi:uncharacterized protein LOC133473493 isoform X2 [Phyllopteryx taeniolatus]|uniref:uncharacterized protein LOC133473493 isoform X2 n=1 Tax=Phyllopteryx taeniolatus TaxID=161469 RepID=UPI002AD2666D|nr:uncharacterized protein LOC133473493 isoform X2 [Phyllopteryx taeniolatus]
MSVVLFVARGCWCGLFQLSLGLGVWVATHPCLNTWKNHTQPKGEKGDDHGGTPWGEGKGGNRPEVQSHSPQAQPGDQDDTPGVGATGITRGRRADPGSGSPRRATLTQPYPTDSPAVNITTGTCGVTAKFKPLAITSLSDLAVLHSSHQIGAHPSQSGLVMPQRRTKSDCDRQNVSNCSHCQN